MQAISIYRRQLSIQTRTGGLFCITVVLWTTVGRDGKVALVYRRPADYSYPRVKDCPRKGGFKTSPLSFPWPGFDKAIHRQEHRVIITLPG